MGTEHVRNRLVLENSILGMRDGDVDPLPGFVGNFLLSRKLAFED